MIIIIYCIYYFILLLLLLLFYIILKMKDCGGLWWLPLRIFLAPSPVQFATYKACPCSMWETRYNWNIVYQIYLSREVHEITKKYLIFHYCITVHRMMLCCYRNALEWTIWQRNDNNYEDSPMMERVVCRNILENWSHVKNTFSACKAGSTNWPVKKKFPFILMWKQELNVFENCRGSQT